MKKTKTDKAARDAIRYYTPEQLRALLSVVTSLRDRAIITVAYKHGLRASEIGMLQVKDVNFVSRRIRFKRLKGSMDSEHLLEPGELRLLKAHIKTLPYKDGALFLSNRQTPISRRMLDVIMKRYGALAGISPELRHFHALKHSLATHMVNDADVDLREVQDWLGHRSLTNTARYMQVTQETRDRRARARFAKMPRI